MKILYVITKSNYGGAQRYVYDLAASLFEKRGTSVIVAFGGGGELHERLRKKGVRTLPILGLGGRVSLFSDLVSFFKLLQIISREKPDVLHLNSSKAGIMGALAGRIYNLARTRRHRAKIIFTAHGWGFTEERPFIQKLTIKYFQWLTVLFSHATIAVSEATRREMSDMPFVERKLTVIRNGIAAPSFRSREDARRELSLQYRIPMKAFWVGTLAELHPNKALPDAFIALSELPVSAQIQFAYIIIGGGGELDRLEALAHEYNLEDIVYLLGYKRGAAGLLPAFDCFLLPSVKEGMPYVLLEAGAAGLPVIASRTGGIPELIEHEKTGLLVAPHSPPEIARALTELSEEGTRREALGGALCRRVSENFTLKGMVQKTTALYESP